jgi:hypothetical protein
MKGRRRTRETENMIQTAVWLPRKLHERLKRDGGERGLGEEIRRRLHMSLYDEEKPLDQPTQALLDAIKQITGHLSHSAGGPWYANRFAFDVVRAAINELLSSCQPSSEAQPEAVDKLKATYGSDAEPETIGRILARINISASGGR